MSFMPFDGGNRICLGKSFAENAAKIMILSIFSKFEFEFKDHSNLGKRFAFHIGLMDPKEVALKLKQTKYK